MRYATSSYTDPLDHKVYPADFAMLDKIISVAIAKGLAIQLQQANDWAPVTSQRSLLSGLSGLQFHRPWTS